MKKLLIAITIALLTLMMPLSIGYAAPETIQDQLLSPVATPIGTFGGIAYIQYDGIFEGQTSTGAFRVPYRITAPVDPNSANRTVIVEPSHYAAGLGALDNALGRDFLLSRGFAHAGIGWSTTTDGKGFDLRILDPKVPGVSIKGGFRDGNGRTDDEIIADFARALAVDPVASQILGRVDRQYVTGFSDSSEPVLRLVTSGRAEGVFDLAFPYTATTGPNGSWDGPDPQMALTDGRYTGKLIILNSEEEGISAPLVDRGVAPRQYRFYSVAGTPHVPDFLAPSFWSMTTPASFQPELRAHFLQGHDWVMSGKQPPLSTHLATANDGTLLRDANGNAISVNASGQPVPRLPFIEIGEAHFIAGFVGSYEAVKTITDLGFASHSAYLKAFEKKLADYTKAGYILKEDADAMRRRAGLCPSQTFTEVYRDAYEDFVAITLCGQ